MIEDVRPIDVAPRRAEPVQTALVTEDSEALARQRQMLEDLKRYQMMQRKQSGAAPPIAGDARETPAAAPADTWPDELRHPAGIRRAVILREILGPPTGLR